MTVANPYDVAARLAEGRPAIDDVEEYVAACRRLGYQHRDLTMHATQIRDWYGGEEGLDLRALDADHAALSAAASAAEDAARMQADLASELSAAWSGRGAVAAHQFVWRSAQAASTVSAAVRTAADVVATLRDALWRAVDARVLATETVDGRQQAQRAEWLAAAKTVTTGTGDLAAASELIELQVKPFVNHEVGSDWLAAMRTAVASINAAYDSAIAGMTTAPPAAFGVPGELGPRPQPPEHVEVTDGGGSVVVPVHTVPAAAVGSAPPAAAPSLAATPAAPWSGPAPVTPPPLGEAAPLAPASAPAAPPSAAPSMPSTPSLGDLGAGTSTLGSGVSGFGQQLADLIGGLVGSADGGLPDAADPDGPTDLTGAEDDPDAEDDADEPEEPGVEEDAGATDEPEEPGEEIVDEAAPEPPPTPEPVSTPAPPPPEAPPAPPGLPEPVADAPPEAAEPTPCEIAADELPQVGE